MMFIYHLVGCLWAFVVALYAIDMYVERPLPWSFQQMLSAMFILGGDLIVLWLMCRGMGREVGL